MKIGLALAIAWIWFIVICEGIRKKLERFNVACIRQTIGL